MSILALVLDYTKEDYERATAYEDLANELKDIRSLRKAAIKLLKVKHIVSKYIHYMKEESIYVGWDSFRNFNYVSYRHLIFYRIPNIIEPSCFICKYKKNELNYSTVTNENNTKIEYKICSDCKNKTICHTCLRWTTRCSLIHSRKLLTWQILLSHKFPKDIIKLITKKVK